MNWIPLNEETQLQEIIQKSVVSKVAQLLGQSAGSVEIEEEKNSVLMKRFSVPSCDKIKKYPLSHLTTHLFGKDDDQSHEESVNNHEDEVLLYKKMHEGIAAKSPERMLS